MRGIADVFAVALDGVFEPAPAAVAFAGALDGD
jgi:hypothetical protein